jgi:hypothetical protein
MAVELVSTLNGNTNEVDPTKAYVVDFSKLQKPEDLVLVLSGLGITFPGNHPIIPHIKQFLNLQNPIDLPQQPKNDLEDRIFKGE